MSFALLQILHFQGSDVKDCAEQGSVLFVLYCLPPLLLGFLSSQPQDLWAGFNTDFAPKSYKWAVLHIAQWFHWHHCKVCLQIWITRLKFFISCKCDFLKTGLCLLQYIIRLGVLLFGINDSIDFSFYPIIVS